MKSLGMILVSILAVFAPIKMAVLTVLILVLADLITGVLAAIKAKDLVTSAGFRRTAVKLFLYEAAILLGFLAETFLIGAAVPVCKMVCAFIGLTEMKSIMENFNAIGGGSLFAGLLEKLNSANLDKK